MHIFWHVAVASWTSTVAPFPALVIHSDKEEFAVSFTPLMLHLWKKFLVIPSFIMSYSIPFSLIYLILHLLSLPCLLIFNDNSFLTKGNEILRYFQGTSLRLPFTVPSIYQSYETFRKGVYKHSIFFIIHLNKSNISCRISKIQKLFDF